jgi:hypothetical protein
MALKKLKLLALCLAILGSCKVSADPADNDMSDDSEMNAGMSNGDMQPAIDDSSMDADMPTNAFGGGNNPDDSGDPEETPAPDESDANFLGSTPGAGAAEPDEDDPDSLGM